VASRCLLSLQQPKRCPRFPVFPHSYLFSFLFYHLLGNVEKTLLFIFFSIDCPRPDIREDGRLAILSVPCSSSVVLRPPCGFPPGLALGGLTIADDVRNNCACSDWIDISAFWAVWCVVSYCVTDHYACARFVSIFMKCYITLRCDYLPACAYIRVR